MSQRARRGARPGRGATRAHAAGTARRSTGWRNLNVEPGDSTLDEMIAAIERGVLMQDQRARGRSTIRATSSSSAASGAGASRTAGWRGGAQPQLPRHLGHLLAHLAGSATRPLRGDGHAVLRQGRAQPGDPRRPRLARLRVRRRRGVRRGEVGDAGALLRPRRRTLTASLRGGEVLLANFDGESFRLRALQPCPRCASRCSVRQAYLTLELIDGRRHAPSALAITRRRRRRTGRRSSGALEATARRPAAAARGSLPSLLRPSWRLGQRADRPPALAGRCDRRDHSRPARAAISSASRQRAGIPRLRQLARPRHWHEVDSFQLRLDASTSAATRR